MSEIIRDESISTESLCTVIENDIGNKEKEILKEIKSEYLNDDDHDHEQNELNDENENHYDEVDNVKRQQTNGFNLNETPIQQKLNGSLETNASTTDADTADNCDTTTDTEQQTTIGTAAVAKPRTKIKKSVSFDPNDEKIQKFISGEPIIDQQNPFKQTALTNGNAKKKRTPPPVPAKRSTLSIKKTVTQQLREREREKEKERERLKNEANKSKAKSPTSPDDFITTEEVLKQSKYVKTYIKNPDPYFVYDPTVLAKIKFEELRELTEKKPLRKLKSTQQTRERLKDQRNKPQTATSKSKLPTFKKVSKPNYPDLTDLKIKVGTEPDGDYFNPAEVTKNAKKFDERARKLHLDSDADLDEIEEPLTKSESSDEVTINSQQNEDTTVTNDLTPDTFDNVVNAFDEAVNQHDLNKEGEKATFTNTIKSKEFQAYLEQKGLTLIPKKIPSGAQSMFANGGTPIRPNTTSTTHVTFRSDPVEQAQIALDDEMAANRQNKRTSNVFQRLLAHSIFASRRNKTTPKEAVPNPRTLYETNTTRLKENGDASRSGIAAPTPIKRVVLERQSFHGRPRVGNLLSKEESRELQQQNERSRKSFASGDDLSLSISSALTNAEYDSDTRKSNSKLDRMRTPVAKPPRRALSGDRLSNRAALPTEQRSSTLKPKASHISRRTERAIDVVAMKPAEAQEQQSTAQFRRTLERQSLIPKRSMQEKERSQVFGRSASMDRNEILRRTGARRLQSRTSSANESLKVPTNSKENLRQDFGPKLTSTPHRETDLDQIETYKPEAARKIFSPVLVKSGRPTNVYVDQQEWERLRAIKERTDRELYYKVLQQQQQHQQQQQALLQQQQRLLQEQQIKRLSDPESIYERLKPNQVIVHQPPTQQAATSDTPVGNFVRGSPQRNTFSGVIRNRQVKIIDGRAVVSPDQIDAIKNQQQLQQQQHAGPRSQSVLDNLTTPTKAQRRGYESDNETPVIMRRHRGALLPTEQPPQRRIGGLLTREEILQKVKEFCRKSLNKTPTTVQQQPHMMHAIYEMQPAASTDISPVSYASVETQQRRVGGGGSAVDSRIYAAPQVPQRMHSLPQQQFVPIRQEDATTSPIYAHVVKRSSLQSNHSELYDHPGRPVLVRRESDAQAVYGPGMSGMNGGATLQRLPNGKEVLVPAQYIVVDSEKLTPAQVLNYYPPAAAPKQQLELYSQPQYVRPHQLQAMPGAYGYITVRDPTTTLMRQQPVRLLDGRSTPLILESSSSPQQVSQIYWTPQHQRLQQQAGLLPVQISPRYVIKQPYALTTQQPQQQQQQHQLRPEQQQQQNCRVTRSGIVQTNTNIPNGHTVSFTESNGRNSASPIIRANTPVKHFQMNDYGVSKSTPLSQQRQFTLPASASKLTANQNQCYDWESGSEAGEVQRIMERQRDSGGESKVNTMLRNLRNKVSHFLRSSK